MKSAPGILLALILASASFFLACLFRFDLDLDAASRYVGPLTPRAISFALTVALGLVVAGLYGARPRDRFWGIVARVMIGVMIGGVNFVMLIFLIPYLQPGREVVALALVITGFFVLCDRIVLRRLVSAWQRIGR